MYKIRGMELPQIFISEKERTFQYDESRPSAPIPSLNHTLAKYLDSGKFVIFGSFGNEPMQSCSVRRVSLSLSSSSSSVSSSSSALASVYSPPSDRFDHRSFISYKCMQLCP